MAINRISTLQTTTALPTTDDSGLTSQSPRIEMSLESTFERGSDSDLDPANFQNTNVTDQQRQGAQQRFDSLNDDDKPQVTAALGTLREAVNNVNNGTGTLDDARAALATAVSTYSSALQNRVTVGSGSDFQSSAGAESESEGAAQIDDIMANTMGPVEDQTAAIAVDLNNKIQAKNEIRTESTELGDMITNWPPGTDTQNFTYQSFSVDSNGNLSVVTKSENLTKDQATQLQADLEDQLNSVDDVTQQQSLDLQNQYQNQQQAMTTLSQILASMHDTMKNTINNLKVS